MINYKNLGGNSSIRSYEYGRNYIIVEFTDLLRYKYTYTSAGIRNVEQMKLLAQQGQGLSSFIMRNVRDLYESKL